MHIQWLGQTCLKLQTKNIDEDIVTVVDAYRPKTGDFPRNMTVQLALFSRGSEGALSSLGEPFVIDTLGEFDCRGVMVSTYGASDGTVLFKIMSEGIAVLHAGALSVKPDDALVEALGKVDVLVVPVGGGKRALSPQDAADFITAVEPRIVIPVGFASDTDPDAGALEVFLKTSGLKADSAEKKIILKAKDLPQEETRLMVLEKTV